MRTKKKKKVLGGARPGAGRKKLDRSDHAQITCILRKDTIEKLQSIQSQYGEVLQFHLDLHPLPTREEYLYLRERKPFTVRIRKRPYPVIVTQPAPLPRKRAAKRNDEAFEKVLAQAKA